MLQSNWTFISPYWRRKKKFIHKRLSIKLSIQWTMKMSWLKKVEHSLSSSSSSQIELYANVVEFLTCATMRIIRYFFIFNNVQWIRTKTSGKQSISFFLPIHCNIALCIFFLNKTIELKNEGHVNETRTELTTYSFENLRD